MILNTNILLGAVAGDIIGSTYEFNNVKTKDFNLYPENSKFTDDTVMTIAVADALLRNKDFSENLWNFGRKYFHGRGYGGKFKNWLLNTDRKPYQSYGNGAVMRVSPVAFFAQNRDELFQKAVETCAPTHDCPESYNAAKYISLAIFMAKSGRDKKEIGDILDQKFPEYMIKQSLDEIRDYYVFDVSAEGTAPYSVKAFLESTDYEDAIRNAISIGGDSDTLGIITGAIAMAYYKEMPQEIADFVIQKLPEEFIEIMVEFDSKYNR